MGAPVLARPIEPSRLSDDTLSPAKLQQRLRRAARLKPRGKVGTETLPEERDDSLSDDKTEQWFVTRTASPRFVKQSEAGMRRLAADNAVLRAAVGDGDTAEDAEVRVAPPVVSTPATETVPEMMPLKDLMRIAERVLERHSVELEKPVPKSNGIFNPKRIRKSPLREALEDPDPSWDPVVAVLKDEVKHRKLSAIAMAVSAAQRFKVIERRRSSVAEALLDRRKSVSTGNLLERRPSVSRTRRGSASSLSPFLDDLATLANETKPATSVKEGADLDRTLEDLSAGAAPGKEEQKPEEAQQQAPESKLPPTILGSTLNVSPMSEGGNPLDSPKPDIKVPTDREMAEKRMSFSSIADLAIHMRRLSVSSSSATLHRRIPSDSKIKKRSDGYVRDRVLPYGEDGPEVDAPPRPRRSSLSIW